MTTDTISVCIVCRDLTELTSLLSKRTCVKVNSKQATRMPEEGSAISLNSDYKSERLPFVIYADFESLTLPVYGCSKSPDSSYTAELQKHVDCGFAYKVLLSDGKHDKKLQRA